MAQIGVGLEPVWVGGVDERIQIGTGLRATDGIGEEPVLLAETKGADGVFDAVVVHPVAPVVAVSHQCLPLIVGILKRIAELQFRYDFGPQSVRPSFELDENRHTVTYRGCGTVHRVVHQLHAHPVWKLNPARVSCRNLFATSHTNKATRRLTRHIIDNTQSSTPAFRYVQCLQFETTPLGVFFQRLVRRRARLQVL